MATHKSFQRWHGAGFTADLLPIIPVNARLTDGTSVKPAHTGKVPGTLTAAGTWSGLGGKWSIDLRADKADLMKWQRWGASVGLQSRSFVGLDIDVDDADLAAAIQSTAEDYLGLAPVRTRTGSARRLMMYRVEAPLKKIRQEFDTKQAVELLASGQQYVVEGQHPAGGEYAWLGEHPCNIGAQNVPLVDAEAIGRFFLALGLALERRGAKLGRVAAQSAGLTTGTRKPLTDPSLWAPSPEAVLELLKTWRPEEMAHDDFIQASAAIKAALGPRREEFYAEYFEWAPGERSSEAEATGKVWDSITDTALGWDWLSGAFGADAAAQVDFDDGQGAAAMGVTDPHNVLESMLSRYVYADAQERYFDMETGQALSAKGFNSRNTSVAQFGRTGVQSAESAFQNEPRACKVSTVTYRPGAARLVNEVVNGTTLRAVNLWRPSAMAPAEGTVTDEDVKPWLDHVAMIFGAPGSPAREHILNYMAFILQHPGVKINHAVVILSNTHGVGKDTVFVPFLAAVGHHNAWTVGPEDLQGAFNPYVERQLIVVAEMANFNKKEMTNKIKPLLASPPYFIQVNKKNVGQYSIPNLGNVIMFTNYDNAISIDEQDRRYWVHQSLTEEARGPDYFKPLYAWYGVRPIFDGPGSMLVAKWLLQRDLTSFDPSNRPAMTEAKQDMIDVALPAATRWLGTVFEKGGAFEGRAIVAAFELTDYARSEFGAPDNVREQHAVSALKRAGYASIEKSRLSCGKIVRLWTTDKACFSLTHVALVKRYEADKATPVRA